MIEFEHWAGLNSDPIETGHFEVPVHQALRPHLDDLSHRAEAAGYQLRLASGYRSFERQLQIWNAKAEGRRPLLNDHGQPLDAASLSEEQLVFAILRWSALPGGSRHHWGTDVDVYNGGPCEAGYRLQLTYEETLPGSVFGDFHQWLDAELKRDDAVFFRPYQSWSGGVAPEPWHLSCAPLSARYQQSVCKDTLRELVATADIALKQTILAHFDEIFRRFVWVDWAYYPIAHRLL